MPKRLRQRRILTLLDGETIHSQEELSRRLAQEGIRVTQATLSRDLRELGLVKTSEGYGLPSAADGGVNPPSPPLPHLLQEFVADIREASNLLVLKTGAGSAQPVAAALDGQQWSEVVGTVAGDDTILIVTPNRRACRTLSERIRELIA